MGLQNGIFTERLPRGYMTIQAYQNSGSGTVAVANSPILSPRSPTTTDIVSPAGNPYQLLQAWKNTTTGAIFEYGGGGVWVEVVDAGGGGPITTLTGNTGGAISPITGNISILGNGQATFAGTAGTLTLTQTAAGYPITPFVVGASGVAGYQTIQSAITAATATGGVVYIQPGTYTENLTLANGVYLVGTNDSPDAGLCKIIGVHTPPATGSCTFSNLYLQSATHVLSSAVAGSATLSLTNCTVNLTNGYIFNLANWTGSLLLDQINDASTINGVVTNAGGSSIFFALSDVGVGTANSMSTTGTVVFQGVNLRCPWSLATGTVADCIASEFVRTVTCANNSVANFRNSSFSTGATASLTQSSSGAIALLNCSVTSSNVPAITGAGAGALTLGGVDFTSDTTIAGTLTLSGANVFKTGALQAVAGTNAAGATPQIVNARQGQVAFTDVINAAAVGALVMTNSFVSSTSVIIASVSCATVGSALVIRTIAPGSGTVTFNVTNLGGTNTGATILINYWIVN